MELLHPGPVIGQVVGLNLLDDVIRQRKKKMSVGLPSKVPKDTDGREDEQGEPKDGGAPKSRDDAVILGREFEHGRNPGVKGHGHHRKRK